MRISWSKDHLGATEYRDTEDHWRDSINKLLKDVLRLPMDLEPHDAKLLYETIKKCAAGDSGVTIRMIKGASYQVGFRSRLFTPAKCVSLGACVLSLKLA